jgi:hypothetical protein
VRFPPLAFVDSGEASLKEVSLKEPVMVRP